MFFYCKAVGAPLAYFADPLDPNGPGGRCVAVYLALLLILHLFVGHQADWLPSKLAAWPCRSSDVMSDKESKESAKATASGRRWSGWFSSTPITTREAAVAPTFANKPAVATDGLRFAARRAGGGDGVANNIDVEAIGRDAVVPTIMLISGGETRLRLPEVYDDGTRVKFPVRMRRVGIVRFGLRRGTRRPDRRSRRQEEGLTKPVRIVRASYE